MSIELSCTSCAKKLRVKDEAAGRKVKCPGCATLFSVPEPATEPAAPVDLLPDEPAAEPAKPAPRARSTRVGAAAPARRPVREPRGAAARPEGMSIGLGLAGGLAAAVLGAFVWYLIAKSANLKIGWIAWGIGGATGFGVALLSGNKDGVVFCAMGAGCALFGWLLGEWMIYAWHFRDLLASELMKSGGASGDPDAMAEVKQIVRSVSFLQYLKSSLGPMSLLFVGLAAVTGWGIPQKMATR